MSQVAGPFSPRVRWLLDSPVDIRMTRRRLSRGLRWMDHRARKSENLREVTDSSTLHSPYWSTRSFGNLLNPIAVRIIFVPKLSLEALRASAIRLWYQFSFFFKTVFRMGRFFAFFINENHLRDSSLKVVFVTSCNIAECSLLRSHSHQSIVIAVFVEICPLRG